MLKLLTMALLAVLAFAGCGSVKPPPAFWADVQALKTEFVRGGDGVQALEVDEDGTMMTVTIGPGWLLFDNMQKRNIAQNFRTRLIQLRVKHNLNADEWTSCYINDAAGGRLAKANNSEVQVYE